MIPKVLAPSGVLHVRWKKKLGEGRKERSDVKLNCYNPYFFLIMGAKLIIIAPGPASQMYIPRGHMEP